MPETLPTYAVVERAIRVAWHGSLTAAESIEHGGIYEELELLAAAPLASKPAHANAVRSAWVRAGGTPPVVPRPGIATPIAGSEGSGVGAIGNSPVP